ncbi:IPT/TIG domain-containing protein [Pedobacter montanisoli]|uniref:IPT/TIG domain-containing protein n=1 Tax=Pedobacter montanisoli TaxID=2923277 RepID=A0ABS9ZWK9_9SPHI|nr:IPT/TIG domain-containing protein [Pedobacter montanisoli]MCJ0742704.1 IPT/TIG domain-containing protein [Pedobacter montanisoli]
MKKLTLFSFLCIFALVITGCKKEKFAPPEIQTLSVTANSPNSISFRGNILATGNQKIKDYGFIYSTASYQVDENNGTKVSLGNSPSKGEFSKTIDYVNSPYSNTILVRAYITDENGTVFGSALSAALPRPSSSAITPSSGKAGDLVKFSGKFYNPSVANVIVNFGNIRAKVITASDSEIMVEVPTGITAAHGQSVTVNMFVSGAAVNTSMYFTILANIKDYAPKSGIVGSSITLTGDNLPNSSSYSGNIPVYFDNVQTSTNYYSSTVMVPFAVSEKSTVSVVINGTKITLPGEFTVIAPQINSVNPQSALPGQTITISGVNYPTMSDGGSGRPMIKFGNGEYQSVYLQNTNVYALNIPASTAEGEYAIYLRVGPHEVQAPQKVKVTAYTVTGFSPVLGGPGREVNLSGSFIAGNSYYVNFGTVSSYGTATSASNLRVTVPTGINAGKVKISVDVPNQKIVAPGEFEITGPTFTSFSPVSGVAGTLITIKGANFYPGTYNTYVRFGTINVTPVSVTDNTIVVAVPSNVTPGAMKLSVVTGGQTVMHTDNFTITN